jgi:hypothetical protein
VGGGEVRYAVETWDPGYTPTGSDDDLDPTTTPVDISVEVAPALWAPIDPNPGEPMADIVFVDGVRRIDSRIWIDDGEVTRPGLCASVAAGAVRCRPGAATVEVVAVERGLYTTVADVEPIEFRLGSYQDSYEPRPTRGDDDARLFLGVHDHLTALEVRLSAGLDGAELVVFDGPLRRRHHSNGVGYVKTQHVQYLPPELQRLVSTLAPGQRTPVFAIGGDFARWSWYLRLQGPVAHGLSGIVRLELPGLGDVSCAAYRAERISAELPRFASEPHKEARAPQNLYPIAGLEHHLRHRLGDTRLLERQLRLTAKASQ